MFFKTGALAAADAHSHHMNGWESGWMWLWGVAMIALFVTLIVGLLRTSGAATPKSSPERPPMERAREILAERYARGDLTTEQYRERITERQ